MKSLTPGSSPDRPLPLARESACCLDGFPHAGHPRSGRLPRTECSNVRPLPCASFRPASHALFICSSADVGVASTVLPPTPPRPHVHPARSSRPPRAVLPSPSHGPPVHAAPSSRPRRTVLTFSLCRWSLRATPSPPPCGLPDRQRVAGPCTSRVPGRGPRGGWVPPVVTQRLRLDKEQKGETHPSLQGRVRGG